jgi:tRNA modification GTPase
MAVFMDSSVIIAPATVTGTSALAVLRLSGRGCHPMASTLAGGPLPVRRPVHRTLSHEGQILDDAVITLWSGPASYTGEDMAEVSCHGNPLIVERIQEAFCQLGARPAGPGEFTQRAFLNGKMDLTQAEGLMDLIRAQSDRALAAARAMKEGTLARDLARCRETLLNLLAHLEAHIDFPDEDIDPEVGASFRRDMEAVAHEFTRLLGTAREGRRVREGLRIVLCGAPNAGKSSLLNALLRQDRAIVSDQPGTTRDTVEEVLMLEGLSLRFIDTAGLRDNPDPIEQLGIARTLEAARSADLVLELVDASDPGSLPPFPATEAPRLRVWTKTDLQPAPDTSGVAVSARSGAGLDDLKATLIQQLQLRPDGQPSSALVNSRQEQCLRDALTHLERARTAANDNHPPELVSADLRQSLRAIGEIAGESTNEDVLDRLFQSFCIGK